MMTISLTHILLSLQVVGIFGGGGFALYKMGAFIKGITGGIMRLNEIRANHTQDDARTFARFNDEIGTVRAKVETIADALTTIAGSSVR